MATTSGDLTATGSVTLTKPHTDTQTLAHIAGTYGTVSFVFEGSLDSTNWFPVAAVAYETGARVTGSVSPSDNAELAWKVPSEGLVGVRLRTTAVGSGTVSVYMRSASYTSLPFHSVVNTTGASLAAQTFTGDVTLSGGVDLIFSGTTGQSELHVTDNLADALSVKIPSGNDLLSLRTTDSDEAVVFPNSVEFFGDSGTKKVVSVGASSVAETLTVATGEYETRLTDNLADAWSVKVAGGADVMVFTTTDNAEAVAITGTRHAQTTAVAITGATTLKLSDSGGIWTVSQGSAYDIDLPSPTSGAGCRYFFSLTAPAANAVTITVAGGAATFVGSVITEGQIVVATGSTLTFASGAAVLGDSIEIQSIATNLYHVRAVSSILNGITIA